ncbi:acetyltransferase [Crocosphaera subtropica ATCC 51142]|uniref:Acetyltransferase n=1 Tax=Crocosphaera subtropica (strain ATCC 51142 / BH68) TaxID=43989 RepID=B1WXW5_CROS5|nr:sugar O-acetyltransferase [Crocosphaera subtropica]ACB50952.1 acetyltransferase [Crocosphaera subtropica ATCC 51142]
MKTKPHLTTERQKMLNGDYYNAFEDNLIKDRKKAQKLCQKLNALPNGSQQKRLKILKQLLHADQGVWIESPFRCDYGYNITLGKNFYANFGCVILDCNLVKIGNNVKLGPNVQIYTATHPINPEARMLGKEMAYPITIGDNVWIGGSSIILPGVTIGHNSVIGAGSIVTKNVPKNVVVVGNPCRIIKAIE